ncbi:hypothetical protein HK099_001657, partial [Clydaea vesicula]
MISQQNSEYEDELVRITKDLDFRFGDSLPCNDTKVNFVSVRSICHKNIESIVNQCAYVASRIKCTVELIGVELNKNLDFKVGIIYPDILPKEGVEFLGNFILKHLLSVKLICKSDVIIYTKRKLTKEELQPITQDCQITDDYSKLQNA